MDAKSKIDSMLKKRENVHNTSLGFLTTFYKAKREFKRNI